MTDSSHDAHDELGGLLRRIDRETAVPPIDASREAALLAAFDAARERPRPVVRRSRWLAIAATVSILGGSAVLWMARDSVTSPVAPSFSLASQEPATDATVVGEFVMWPGAAALPPFENGHLVRMDLPAAMLPELGFFPGASDAKVVRADVLIGQDGLARAVRLVSGN